MITLKNPRLIFPVISILTCYLPDGIEYIRKALGAADKADGEILR